MKKVFICSLVFILCACANTNPPEPKQAKGNWEVLTTTKKSLGY